MKRVPIEERKLALQAALQKYEEACQVVREAKQKRWEARRGIDKVLNKWEERQVYSLRDNLLVCYAKVGAALSKYHGWRWGPTGDGPGLYGWVIPYDRLPFYWRVVAFYFSASVGEHKFTNKKGKTVCWLYFFHEDCVERKKM